MGPMKTAISIPDDIFLAADQAAHRLGYSRSELFTQAVRRFLQEQGPDPVTEALNRVHAGAATDPTTANFGRQLIDSGAWTW